MLAVIPFFGPVKFTIPFIDFELHGFGFMVALGLFLGTEMAMQKVISHSKGHKVKITKTNPDGTKTSYFKWKQERQK